MTSVIQPHRYWSLPTCFGPHGAPRSQISPFRWLYDDCPRKMAIVLSTLLIYQKILILFYSFFKYLRALLKNLWCPQRTLKRSWLVLQPSSAAHHSSAAVGWMPTSDPPQIHHFHGHWTYNIWPVLVLNVIAVQIQWYYIIIYHHTIYLCLSIAHLIGHLGWPLC